MKLFSNLSEKHKERAIHMAEHIVLDTLLEKGISVPTDAPIEVIERFDKITTLIAEAKKIEDPSDQADFLFDNDLTSELIFQDAYDLASTSLYIEPDEIAFQLSEIDESFSETGEHLTVEHEKEEGEKKENGDEETLIAPVGKSNKKDMSHLN